MNRIYQGRVSNVEIPTGNKDEPWQPLDDWQSALWQHHELFQDAVNYYTLALAAMAAGVEGDSKQSHALREWAARVKETWQSANRKSQTFAGPQARLGLILKLSADKCGFEQAATSVLRSSRATAGQRAAALLQLLHEADKGDLNKVCGERIAFLCPANPHQKKRPTSKAVSSVQEQKRQQEIRKFHQMSQTEALKNAGSLGLNYFLTQPSSEVLEGADAVKELRQKFSKAAAKFVVLKSVSAGFEEFLTDHSLTLKIPPTGRKPSGLYPFAAVFKFYPCEESLRAFLLATKTLADAKDKAAIADVIADARVGDQPHFEFFTNLALVPGDNGERDTRAVWFEFDLAAFVEAIKAPHRYFQDTIKREDAADRLSKQIDAMKRKGRESSGTDDESDFVPGFEDDNRITLLKTLVQEKLKWIAEAEGDADKEYAIRERTVRGFSDIKRRWLAAAEAGNATEENLLDILAKEQAAHRDDFGSATLYCELAKPEFHPIWRERGSQPWHADDPLAAWLEYKELQAELADKQRAIRFTPAHAKISPRYFIIPKQGRFGSDHEAGQLSLTTGVIIRSERGLVPTTARIHYTAPRLCRDQIRSSGDSNLEEAPWLQPMMAALGLDKSPDRVNFANCRVTLQPANEKDIQLTFPVEVNAAKIETLLGYRSKWDYRISGKNKQMNFAQFNYSASEPRSETSLRWPSDIAFAKEAGTPRKSEPVPWHEKLDDFRCAATDLGQRDAGAFARLFIGSSSELSKRPSRFIGATGSKQWRAVLERSGLFRLPGEDAQVWREISELDRQKADDSGKPFDFREELWGERGRPARSWEADETAELMRKLEVPPEDMELSLLNDGWRDLLSFPEQNDKLLVAMRRYQSRIARLHRWCFFLKGDDKQQKTAWGEIAECEDMRLVSGEQRAQAKKCDPRLQSELESQLSERLKRAPVFLVSIANRILPLRGRSWLWEKHPAGTEENTLHHLTQHGPSLDSKDKPVWLRGQRGLSLERIEQIEELRKRFQSLNQTLRRQVGGKPPIRRDESVPDPCRDLLDKLDNLKEQRVNQTAHMILAEALGLRLAPPPTNKDELRLQRDQHGVYEKILDKSGKWIGPVDFIIIEDLSRYRASQGRAPRENSRLMKWCHRAVRDKLKQLCEVFGLPILETPAAYSSRFCSRSGVPGFRASEIAPGFENDVPWSWIKEKKDDNNKPTVEAGHVLELIQQMKDAQNIPTASGKPLSKPRTLFAPLAGGPVFIPVVDSANGVELTPALAQADINAAINLALRAVANPKLWPIHPRLRSQRESGEKASKGKKAKAKQETPKTNTEPKLLTREKRKFGEAGKSLIVQRASAAKADDTRQPNLFADFAGLDSIADKLATKNPRDFGWLKKEWISAEITGEANTPRLLHGKSFWGTVKAVQWKRIKEINEARIATWKEKANPMP